MGFSLSKVFAKMTFGMPIKISRIRLTTLIAQIFSIFLPRWRLTCGTTRRKSSEKTKGGVAAAAFSGDFRPVRPEDEKRSASDDQQVTKRSAERAPKSRGSADDDQAHMRENRWQNQGFEGNCSNHLSRLLRSRRPPTFWRSPWKLAATQLRSSSAKRRHQHVQTTPT